MRVRLPSFDVMLDMARNDPQGLEALRRSLTDAVITKAPTESARRRLRGLQFRVDAERQRARSPLGATIRISELMCQSLGKLHRSMVAPDSLAPTPATPEGEAHVVQLFEFAGGDQPAQVRAVWPPEREDL